MLKSVTTLILVLATGLTLGYVFRESIEDALDAWTARDMFVHIEAATFQPGPDIGTPLPALQADHEGSRVAALAAFSRGNGTILIALRSVDWCAYCKTQLMRLQERKSSFDANGIGLVAITYDHPDVQRVFINRHEITIPLLSDQESATFRNLGILNTNHQPGDAEYGVPHPGAIVVGRDGIVRGKLFVENPNLRVYSSEILDYAKKSLGLRAPL
jgi:peroxiredoxin